MAAPQAPLNKGGPDRSRKANILSGTQQQSLTDRKLKKEDGFCNYMQPSSFFTERFPFSMHHR